MLSSSIRRCNISHICGWRTTDFRKLRVSRSQIRKVTYIIPNQRNVVHIKPCTNICNVIVKGIYILSGIV